MTAADVALIVIAKEPVPGRCKTRLCPPLEPEQAGALALAALEDTLTAVAGARASRRVLVLDGLPGPWIPEGFEVIPQAAGGLAQRLAAAFDAVGGPALLIGMDTPQLSAAQLDEATEVLARDGVDAVIGSSPDGGYWSIGLRRPDADVFAAVPMSSPGTGAAQRRSLGLLGLHTEELPTMLDFDTIDDALAVAELCPASRFASRLGEMQWDLAA